MSAVTGTSAPSIVIPHDTVSTQGSEAFVSSCRKASHPSATELSFLATEVAVDPSKPFSVRGDESPQPDTRRNTIAIGATSLGVEICTVHTRPEGTGGPLGARPRPRDRRHRCRAVVLRRLLVVRMVPRVTLVRWHPGTGSAGSAPVRLCAGRLVCAGRTVSPGVTVPAFWDASLVVVSVHEIDHDVPVREGDYTRDVPVRSSVDEVECFPLVDDDERQLAGHRDLLT